MDEADSDVEVVYESIMRRYSDAEIIHEPVQSLKDEASSRSNHGTYIRTQPTSRT